MDSKIRMDRGHTLTVQDSSLSLEEENLFSKATYSNILYGSIFSSLGTSILSHGKKIMKIIIIYYCKYLVIIT